MQLKHEWLKSLHRSNFQGKMLSIAKVLPQTIDEKQMGLTHFTNFTFDPAIDFQPRADTRSVYDHDKNQNVNQS